MKIVGTVNLELYIEIIYMPYYLFLLFYCSFASFVQLLLLFKAPVPHTFYH
jgi:hypothetical protein